MQQNEVETLIGGVYSHYQRRGRSYLSALARLVAMIQGQLGREPNL
jgi:hypothetical protein